MKVGDYVRIKWGNGLQTISQCKNIVDMGDTQYSKDDFYIHTDKSGEVIYKTMIIKSSPNIIDLIELGDLVRLFMEDDVDKEDTNTFEVVAIPNDRKTIGVFTGDFEIEFFPVDNLRGIVTKEQFESMEYKIGE